MICLSQYLIFTNRESLLEKEQEERESLQFKMALFALQKFFIKENLAVIEKQLNSKNHSVGRNSHKKLSENSKKPGSISLSSYLQCEPSIASSVFSIWLFFARFESILSISLPDLKDFVVGLQAYAGEKVDMGGRPREHYLDLINALGIRFVSFLMRNEADLPILLDETQAVNHIISCHEALLKFVVNFDCVRSRVDSNNWPFVLLAILLLHSPSQTSLFDQTITDLCSEFLTSSSSSPPLPSLLTLLKEAINLASLTSPLRDSLIFSVNPLTGKIVSRGRPKNASFSYSSFFSHRKKKLSAVDRFRIELNQISYCVENPYSLKKRVTQRNEEHVTKHQQIWLHQMVQECFKFLPRFVDGNLAELAESIGLGSHPIMVKLQSTLEECRAQQNEEGQSACHIAGLRGVRRLQPSFISPNKQYYFLPNDKRRVYFTISGKQRSPLLSDVGLLCNRLDLNGV